MRVPAAVGVAAAGVAAAVLAGTTATSSAPVTTYYYRVAAVNAAGEGPKSNELAATVPASLAAFQDFVSHMQAAAYYGKWVRDNPGETARWTPFRDGVLAGQFPAAPVMSTNYGRALVDAGRGGEVRG